MIALAHSTNKTLMGHLLEVNKKVKLKIDGQIRNNILNYITDLGAVKAYKKKDVFIYNTSFANLISSAVSKLYKCHIIFHLHDVKPHSGHLNPIIYLIQALQLRIADKVLVYSESLVAQAKKSYFLKNKIFFVTKHGFTEFNYKKTEVCKNTTTYGFFGRNMPYKNVKSFVLLSKKIPNAKFYIFGSGYNKISNNNKHLKIMNGYIDSDYYYSAMQDVDYVVIPYKKISFSGVISDAIALNKTMIVSKEVKKEYNLPNMYLLDGFKEQKNNNIKKRSFFGWEEYARDLKRIKKYE